MVNKRILGLETEYGVTCVVDGQRRLSPDEVARYLFRRVVAWGRSSNVFLPNGGRLYLDVGSHPEYATAECDKVSDLISQDQAGDRIIEELAIEAEKRLNSEGIQGQIHLFKNNIDAAGNSYGCHENYSISRKFNFQKVTESVIPFLITRQIFTGAGKWLSNNKNQNFQLSQRSDHMWESISSATTRSRPIINTRDEPHADPEEYRRLHVIVGDSNMSQTTTNLKVCSTEMILQLIEIGQINDEFNIENPIRTLRNISSDLTFSKKFRLSNGKEVTALNLQEHYLESVINSSIYSEFEANEYYKKAIDLWEKLLNCAKQNDFSSVDKDIDWVIKKKYMDQYQEKNGLKNNDPRMVLIDITFHNIRKDRGIFYILEKFGLINTIVDQNMINHAMDFAPESTRAKLRGEFIKKAQEKKRDYTVDWVHLKINDQNQRTVVCKDPFKFVDERVQDLIGML
ncbi:MAG: Pup--protein ligase [Actinobacteria bacterium]|nr:Pup--protein ligase [Actinomycetota bacterium]